MKLLQPRRFHPLKAIWVLAVLTAFLLYTTHRDRPARLWAWSGAAFGSTYTVKIVTRDLNDREFARVQNDVESILHTMDAQMSTWRPESDLSRFNAAETTEPVTLPADLVDIVRAALDISRASGGAFDVTFAPMFALWGFGKDGPKHAPREEEIAATRERCGHEKLRVVSSNQLQKTVPTLQFNLNAIAPGHASDRIAALLFARGWSNHYVDVGGEILAHGVSPRGDAWRVGLERPEFDQPYGQDFVRVVPLANCALATSGDYRQYGKDEQGRVFSHLFDPRIGRPATGRVASVSVMAASCRLADALSTTLFVLGPEEGLPWLASNFQAEAIFLMREDDGRFREITTAGFPAR